MAIVKNEIPLLEFSTEQHAYLRPDTPEKTLPRLCLVTYFSEILDAFVETYQASCAEEYVTEMRTFPIYRTEIEGYEVGVTLGALGAGAAAKQIDFLYGHGAQTVIAAALWIRILKVVPSLSRSVLCARRGLLTIMCMRHGILIYKISTLKKQEVSSTSAGFLMLSA